jgi:serine kinase of HPr protein (carbohydrate metabolism regulator)
MTFSKDTIVTFTNNRSKLIAQLRKLSQHKSMDDFFSYQIHNWIVLHCFFESPEEIINICYESNRSIVTERWNQFKNENGIKEL